MNSCSKSLMRAPLSPDNLGLRVSLRKIAAWFQNKEFTCNAQQRFQSISGSQPLSHLIMCKRIQWIASEAVIRSPTYCNSPLNQGVEYPILPEMRCRITLCRMQECEIVPLETRSTEWGKIPDDRKWLAVSGVEGNPLKIESMESGKSWSDTESWEILALVFQKTRSTSMRKQLSRVVYEPEIIAIHDFAIAVRLSSRLTHIQIDL
jgi:hypothetical protein